jgi:hypothetical protein
MLLGMPVVAVACTEAVEAVPPEAGVISTRVATLTSFTTDPGHAARTGAAARAAALSRYALPRFLKDWDALLSEITRSPRRTAH